MNAEQLEKWIEVNSEWADKVYERHANFQSTKKYVCVDDLRELFAGKVLVPVELLESAAIAIISPYIKRELQAIIAKENT